jgi:hypothetical protein
VFGDAEEDPQPCRTSDDMGDAEEEGLEISKVSFEELKKALPSLTRSVEGEILWEVRSRCSNRVRATTELTFLSTYRSSSSRSALTSWRTARRTARRVAARGRRSEAARSRRFGC